MKDLFEPRERRRKNPLQGDRKHLIVYNKNRVPMANAPWRFCSTSNGLLLFLENGNKKKSLESSCIG